MAGHTLTAYGFRNLGGRVADFRSWAYRCENGTTGTITQYVTVTPRAYVLFTDNATPTVSAMLASVAAHSALPAATAPLRYDILGIANHPTKSSDGYVVNLSPAIRLNDGQFVPIPGGAALNYLIPSSLVPDQGVTLGGPIELTTDGYHVTFLAIIGG